MDGTLWGRGEFLKFTQEGPGFLGFGFGGVWGGARSTQASEMNSMILCVCTVKPCVAWLRPGFAIHLGFNFVLVISV